MIKVTISTQDGVITNEGQFDDQATADAWAAQGTAEGWWAADALVHSMDMSASIAQDTVNAQALAYLASTDWYVIRFADTGVAIPDDIKTARATARAQIVRAS